MFILTLTLTLTTIFYTTIGESTFLDGGAKPDSINIPIRRPHPGVAVFEARRLSHSDPDCQTAVSVLLQSDEYGEETSFEFVYQGTVDVVASQPLYSINQSTLYRFDYSLQGDHCYTFNITDGYGDGYVQIEIDDTLVFDSRSTSGARDSFDFCLEACTTTAEPTTAEATTAAPTESSDSDSEDVSSADSDSGKKKRKKKGKKKGKKKSSGESYSDSGDMALAVVDNYKLDGEGKDDDASLTVSLYWNENQIWILYAMLIIFVGTNGLVFVYVCKNNKNVQVYHVDDNNEELPSNNI